MDNKNYHTDNSTGRDRRGFASMDPDQQRKIASKGGKASHRGDLSNSRSESDNSYEETNDNE